MSSSSKDDGPASKPAKASPSPSPAPSSSPTLNFKAFLYMSLLAMQFGVQPILTRRYTPPDIARSSVILTQEIMKFCMAYFMLKSSGTSAAALKDWTVTSWMSVALVPAMLYAVQNLAALLAYQNLDGFTFNVLNQTKTLSAAFCCWLIMNRRQSFVQIIALIILLLAACIMEGIIPLSAITSSFLSSETIASRKLAEHGASKEAANFQARHFTHGVVPILVASFLSGLAGAMSEKNLQGVKSRNSYLFSMELCAGSTLMLLVSLLWSEDGKRIWQEGFWHGWTFKTLIPIASNSAGGIVVGLVTKHAGSVRKGFALIFGILLSAILQAFMVPDQTISESHIVGGCLAAVSLYLHATNPPAKAQVTKPVKQE